MNLIGHIHLKRNKTNNLSSSSVALSKKGKLINFEKNINKEIYKAPFLNNNILPKIKKTTTLKINNDQKLINKKLYFNANRHPKKSDRINYVNSTDNSSIFKINNNIISINKKALFNNKIKHIYNQKNYNNNIQFENSPFVMGNNINYNINKDIKPRRANSILSNENLKLFTKTVNVYYKNKNKSKIKEIIDENNNNENIEIDDNNNDIKEDNKYPKTKSMFMTAMNFAVQKKDNNEDDNYNENIIKEDKIINYDYLNFKELLKYIESNKKKIIDNQNDIDNMIKTAKDTHMEIWKYNHYNK